LVPISGDDWSVNWFETNRSELPSLSEVRLPAFLGDIEEFMASDAPLREPAAPKRKAAAKPRGRKAKAAA
jgi:hypothetical protein